MRKVFRVYDDDDNGLISYDNLVRCADYWEVAVSGDEIKSMIEMADCGKKQAINVE
jgi:Ca2+-binding EF-hand superfamily protein